MAVEIHTPIFNPLTAGRKMEILPWGSGSGSNIKAMVKGATNYRVVAMLYDRKEYHGELCRIPEIAKQAGVPSIYVDSGAVMKNKKNEQMRKDYYKRVVDEVNDASAHYKFHVDLVPLGGFMLLLSEPALSAYKDKIINVHPADLAIRDVDGKRFYTGGKAVLNVVKDRLTTTKSTIHILLPETDAGEILTQKAMPIEYPNGIENWTEDEWKKFADYVQGSQKKICDWPAYILTIRMIADGAFALGNEKNPNTKLRAVFLDGAPLSYEGHQVPDSLTLEKLLAG